MNLIGVIGKQGFGKTVSAVMIAKLFQHATNFPLYANFTIDGQNGDPINDFAFLRDTNNAVVIIDEIYNSIDSREYRKNIESTSLFSVLRKKGIYLIYTTQQIGKLDKRVRDETVYGVQTYNLGNGIHRLIFGELVKMNESYSLTNPIEYVVNAEPFYHMYDTNEVPLILKWTG